MKKIRALTVLVLVLTLTFCVTPSALADVPVENVNPHTAETIVSSGCLVNRLEVVLSNPLSVLERQYTVEDFPEVAEYLVSIDQLPESELDLSHLSLSEKIPYKRTVFITTNTTNAVDLLKVIRQLEDMLGVWRVLTVKDPDLEDTALVPLVPPENIFSCTEESIIKVPCYANRLHVILRNEYSCIGRQYVAEDFPEIAEDIVSIDKLHDWSLTPPPGYDSYKTTIYMTLNTTTRVDLLKVIRKLETSPKVYKVMVSYTTGLQAPVSVPDGDLNNNGYVTADESLKILQHSVGKVTLTQKEWFFADMDRDEIITSNDALLSLQTSVFKIEETGYGILKWTEYLNTITPTDVLYPN